MPEENGPPLSLAIPTVTANHEGWLRRGFVANRAASASASKRNLHDGYHCSFWIFFKLRQRRIHLVPRMRIGCPHIHLQIEPARIIQARGSNRGKMRGGVGIDDNRRAAVRAKAPARHAARLTGRGMEAR